jgi:glutamate synthase domain-containing protein 2
MLPQRKSYQLHTMQARYWFIVIATILIVAIALMASYLWHGAWWLYILIGPFVLLGIYDMIQAKHAITRNFPVLGHMRYVFEAIRPEMMQYFVENDSDGRPFHRIYRSMIYQRAKHVNDTAPFGTQMNVYRAGYEWLEHSIYANSASDLEADPRILIGGPHCKQPYSSSLLNISAMSFGSLSKNAVMALNLGAKQGNFAHNTGEGGVSPYHLRHGGDLIWQVGTGYFGCRSSTGGFSEKLFETAVAAPSIKMVEIKLSQGAKPGHGGILPASKNTPEIAAIRGVQPHRDVLSPPTHSAFKDAEGLMHFVQKLRELSGGKPIGFKLCIGKRQEFDDLCDAMISTGIQPDFITIDGGEGGTGAAPVEFSNHLGMPLRDGLTYADDTLKKKGLRKDIRIICAGKIVSGFHLARALALGADGCNSARAMMMAVGCIQALRCNNNTCPTGVATQNPALMRGLNVEDKALRAANYHTATVHSLMELIAAAGLSSPHDLNRSHIQRRVGQHKVANYGEIYPEVE